MESSVRSPHLTVLRPSDPSYPPLLRGIVRYGGDPLLRILGNPELLLRQSFGIICSRRCPGSVILRMYELAQKLKLYDVVVAGGFHSPMERECFDILGRGRTLLVLCPARAIERMRPRPPVADLLLQGRLAVVSPFGREASRCTERLAFLRNRFVASLSAAVIVPHASRGSSTELLAAELLLRSRPVLTFDDPSNSRLLDLGAQRLEWSTLQPGLRLNGQ